ncbi:Venom carboxylesterase-6-like protein [Cladobotryum mycophilum]|uniref:Carboxylic ester hydrolase n=1 Tax=Cladobotryum mycophilum TaxID=491253 RepID=A0ABR0SZQ6_9HYPO
MWPQRALLTCLGLAKVSVCTPQPSDSSWETVFSNDLLGIQSASTKAILLLDGPVTNQAASLACAALHESLVDPIDYPPPSSLGVCLRSELNLAYAGIVTIITCNAQLPVLCTQTAPFSNSTYADNSEKWQVQTKSGSQNITGYRDRVGFRFLGVRYAEQPERFTYSTLYDKSGQQSAISYGSECTQRLNIGGSEDCLFLNIFTTYLPRTNVKPAASQLKPVVFYIHGGGFLVGAGSLPDLEGDVVVVTINYRLGAFGFLALDDGFTNGNFGLSDQITALDWVISHIASFGGDPTRITIFGQSAGAASVAALLGSPKAVGKYAAAMPMSNLGGLGSVANYKEYPSISAAAALMGPLLAATACTNATSQVDCLRASDASDIGIYGGSAVYITVDGTYINSSHLVLDGSGYVAHVPLLLGGMRDEGAALTVYPNTTNITQAIIVDGFDASQYQEALFPVPPGPNATLNVFNATTHFSTDAMARCFNQAIAYAGSKNRVFKSVWYYEYERSYQSAGFEVNVPVCDAPVTMSHPYGDTNLPYFKCHGGDVYYVFGNLLRSGRQLRDNIDLPFSQLIVDSLMSFARSYTPNPDVDYLRKKNHHSTLAQIRTPGGTWQPVASGTKPVRRLDWPSKQAEFDEIEQCQELGMPLDFLA